MKIELRAEHAHDDAATKAATGRSLADWYRLLDGAGGPARGRRELGNLLQDTHKLDPWWATTLLIGHEAAHGLVEKDGRPKGYMVCATKAVKASPARCQAAFADAKALDAWLGAKHAGELVDGGTVTNADGNRLAVRKITPGKTIRFVWQQADAAPDTPVEVKFQPVGERTTVMVTHDRLPDRAAADGFRRAWGAALEKLKGVVEAGA